MLCLIEEIGLFASLPPTCILEDCSLTLRVEKAGVSLFPERTVLGTTAKELVGVTELMLCFWKLIKVEQILICLLISLTRILITQKQCFISSGKAQDYSEKKSNILAELFNNTLPIKIDTLLEFVSFKRPSKFLEQGGYSWALGEVLAWNPAGKSACLLCGVCVWH